MYISGRIGLILFELRNIWCNHCDAVVGNTDDIKSHDQVSSDHIRGHVDEQHSVLLFVNVSLHAIDMLENGVPVVLIQSRHLLPHELPPQSAVTSQDALMLNLWHGKTVTPSLQWLDACDIGSLA